jgi:hypothetical protein
MFFSGSFFKILKWIFLILVGLFIILVIGRVIYRLNEAKTDEQIIKIHNTKLTLDDVMGKNLPPDPGPLADATVEGVDANQNGIRDDVELAIFKEYPNSAKTRAVLLQYALALQMEVIQPIVNTKTVTEVIREQSRAFVCIGNIVSRKDSKKFDEETNFLTKFVKEKQFNTRERVNARNTFLKDVRSYSDLDATCDIDYLKLPN